MRPKPTSRSREEIEAQNVAVLREEEERNARDLARSLEQAAGVVPGEPVDERPIDLGKELGVDWRSKEFQGYKPGSAPKKRR